MIDIQAIRPEIIVALFAILVPAVDCCPRTAARSVRHSPW